MNPEIKTHSGKKRGRKPGSKNVNTKEMRFDLLKTLRDKGFDPVAELVKTHEIARAEYVARKKMSAKGFGVTSMLQIALECESAIMQYVYPRLRATEVTGAGGADLFQSFAEMVRDALQDDLDDDSKT